MRLFVGIALPAQAREALARLAGGIRGARWVASENLHLTLRFIGDVDADMAEDLDAVLGVVRVPPFSLALSGVGVFERRGRVHAAWAGTAPQAALADLRDRVESAAVRGGLPPEGRRFTPHVTVARMKNVPLHDVTPWIENNAGFVAEPMLVDQFHLYRSHLGRAGANYEIVMDYPLDVP